MRFEIWNVRSLYRVGTLKTVASELTKWQYKRSYGVRVVVLQQTTIHFFHGIGNANHQLGRGFFVHKEIILAVKKVEFFNNMMSYITPRSC